MSSLLRKLGVGAAPAVAAVADRVSTASPASPRPFSGLPTTSTTFVGRPQDRDAVIAALADSRLVTMLGPGGLGKTWLAIAVVEAVAPTYPAGGAFVDLVPAGAGFVTWAVTDALDVAERPAQPFDQAVLDRLGQGRALLVLDNCEHVVDEVSDLVAGRCPPTRPATRPARRRRHGHPDPHRRRISDRPRLTPAKPTRSGMSPRPRDQRQSRASRAQCGMGG